MRLQAITTAPGTDEDEVLRLAGAVEDASEHPIGQAIAREAAARFGGLLPVTGFTPLPGAGVRGVADGHTVTVGSPALFAERGCPSPVPLRRAAAPPRTRARPRCWPAGTARSAPCWWSRTRLRPGSAAAVARIQRLGLATALLTGDSERTAQAVAAQLKIPKQNVFAAGRGRTEKAGKIRQLQGEGFAVAMVGDGVNDAAALAQADLGMAAGTGTDAAIGAADLTLVNSDPSTIAESLLLARTTLTVDPGQPGLGLRLQRDRDPGRGARLPQPAVRRDRHGGQLADRDRQQPAAPALRAAAPGQAVRPIARASGRVRTRRGRPVSAPVTAGRGTQPDPRAGGRRGRATAWDWLRELARAAAGPVICAAVLIGLLSAWVVTGGTGDIVSQRVEVTQAAVPMRAFTGADPASPSGPADTFLTIWNPGQKADELLSVSSPIAHRIVLVRRSGPEGPGHRGARPDDPGRVHAHAHPVRHRRGTAGPGAVRERRHGAADPDLPAGRPISVTADVSAPGTP